MRAEQAATGEPVGMSSPFRVPNEDTQQAAGVVIPIRIAPWLRAEFLDIAGVRMTNPNAVPMLTVTIDGSTDDETVCLSMSYRYLTDDTEAEDCA